MLVGCSCSEIMTIVSLLVCICALFLQFHLLMKYLFNVE